MINKQVKSKNVLYSIFFGALAAIFIFIAFYFVAKYYYSFYPPLGNDFYHTFDLINFFKNNLNWPPLSWRFIWHFGGPSIIAYPWLNLYLVQPLVKFFGLYHGAIYYFLGSIFLYGYILYFLFYRLSKSFLLSIGLAVGVIWSASAWRLIIAGSLTLAVNQFLFVLALLFIIIYLQGKNRKFLFLSALVSGLSIISQSGSAFPFIIPIISLIILTWWPDKEKFWQIKRKLKDFCFYLVTSLLIASYYLYHMIVNVLASRKDFEVFDWMRNEAFSSIYTKTNPVIIALFVVFLLGVIIFKNLRRLKIILPFLIAFLYLVIFNFTSVYGINPFGASLAPAENWYILTFLIALSVAFLWQILDLTLKKHLSKWLRGFIAVAAFILLLMPFGFWQSQAMIESFKNTNYVCGAPDGSVSQALVKNDFSGINEAYPSWFEKDNTNWRFLTVAWCTDLWWNSLNKIPLVGGYDTLLLNRNKFNYLNWIYQTFTGGGNEVNLEKDPELTKNYAFFLTDWFGVRYIEKYSRLPKYEELFILEDRKSEFVLEVNKDATSPIVKPTKVLPLLVVSTADGYDTVLRVLAQENLNSRLVIPIQGSPYIEDLTKEDLSHFGAILLYNYKYKKEANFKNYPQEPWDKLASFVKNGGLLIMETGSNVKESDIKNLPNVTELPEVFPVNKTEWRDLGSNWQLTADNQKFLEGVDINKFSNLIYESNNWKLSSSDMGEIRPWAKSVLSQATRPILVSGKLGQGEVVWSGLTLPYHIQTYRNFEESKLFRHFFEKTIGLKEEKTLAFDFSRNKSENISIKADDFSGVLFKEDYSAGWRAKQADKDLNIYKAGFHFMYIPAKGSGEVKITYVGESKYWLMFLVSLLVIFSIFLYLILGKRLSDGFNKLFKFDKIINKTKSWWEKDEDEK